MFTEIIGEIKKIFNNLAQKSSESLPEVWVSGQKARVAYPTVDLRSARRNGVRFSKLNEHEGRGCRYMYCLQPDLKNYVEQQEREGKSDGRIR